MTFHRRQSLSPCAAATISSLAVAIAGDARAQCMYSVQIIESPICPGNTTPLAYDINNHGHVCGEYSPCIGSSRPFFWSPESGFVDIDLGEPGDHDAKSLNESDSVVGEIAIDATDVRPYRWRWADGSIVVLNPLPDPPPPLPPPASHGSAQGISSDGTIVGSWGGVYLSPFSWLPEVEFSDLTGEVGYPGGQAYAINDAHWICGSADVAAKRFGWRGFVLTPEGCTILPTVDGGLTSEAHAIASNGLVCGWGMRPSNYVNYPRGFLWRNGRMEDVGSPDPLKPYSFALDVNALGQVVGEYGPGGSRGFLWQDGNFYYIKPLLASNPQGITVGAGINDRGQIIAWGGGVSLVLTPIRTRPGDATIDCKVDERDVLAVIEFWGKEYELPDMPGDLNDDGVVNGVDLALVLGDWG
ncbi:MAG: hypothetical protein U0572_07475 [Phycisphaerales bacterium]